MQLLVDPDFWSMLADISTALGFGMVIYAAIVGLTHLREATRTRHLEAMLRVYEMIGSKHARAQRRFIYTQLRSTPEDLTPEEREVVEEVSVTFDKIGNLVEKGLVPEDELMTTHCEIFIRAWQTLEPYIMHYRQLISENHVKSFERLYRIALDYYRKEFPGKSPPVVDVWSAIETGRQSRPEAAVEGEDIR